MGLPRPLPLVAVLLLLGHQLVPPALRVEAEGADLLRGSRRIAEGETLPAGVATIHDWGRGESEGA
eukprot:6409328-Heterocapsa_arctica.AAC.1